MLKILFDLVVFLDFAVKLALLLTKLALFLTETVFYLGDLVVLLFDGLFVLALELQEFLLGLEDFLFLDVLPFYLGVSDDIVGLLLQDAASYKFVNQDA